MPGDREDGSVGVGPFVKADEQGFLAAGHTVAEDSDAVNDEEGPLVAREGLDDVAGGGDEPGAAVGAVVDEARAGTIGRLDADDLRCDLGDTLGPVRHFRRTGADVSGGRVRVIDAPVRPGRGSSRPEESTRMASAMVETAARSPPRLLSSTAMIAMGACGCFLRHALVGGNEGREAAALRHGQEFVVAERTPVVEDGGLDHDAAELLLEWLT